MTVSNTTLPGSYQAAIPVGSTQLPLTISTYTQLSIQTIETLIAALTQIGSLLLTQGVRTVMITFRDLSLEAAVIVRTGGVQYSIRCQLATAIEYHQALEIAEHSNLRPEVKQVLIDNLRTSLNIDMQYLLQKLKEHRA